MESTRHKPAIFPGHPIPKAIAILFWVFTALFCLEMSFTAYYELLPQGVQAFARLGFSGSYFRFELSLAKLAELCQKYWNVVAHRRKLKIASHLQAT